MKTTIELPDEILRRTKVFAAQNGVSMKSLIVKGLETLLSESESTSGNAPLQKIFGGMQHRSGETEKISADIEEAFEQIDSELWT